MYVSSFDSHNDLWDRQNRDYCQYFKNEEVTAIYEGGARNMDFLAPRPVSSLP